MENSFKHYGILRRSGRYPWGSGNNPKTGEHHGRQAKTLIAQSSEAAVAKLYGISVRDLRKQISLESIEEKQRLLDTIATRKNSGMSNAAIAKELGVSITLVNQQSNTMHDAKVKQINNVAEAMRDALNSSKVIDIGSGAEADLGVKRGIFDIAERAMVNEGYVVHKFMMPSVSNPKNLINMRVLTTPDVEWKDIVNNPGMIGSFKHVSYDGGHTIQPKQRTQQLDSKRVMVVYGEEGKKNDGLVVVNANKKDTNLGTSRYAQVRIGVDGTHYIKGMAVASSKMPPGVDVIVYSKKDDTGNKLDALKKVDPEAINEYGAVIKPGGTRGVINIIREEGEWGKWKDDISAQVLTKQSIPVVKERLDATRQEYQTRFDKVKTIPNAVLRQKSMLDLAETIDTRANELSSIGYPTQTTKVLLPINDLPQGHVYAPGYKNGELLYLIRYPHAGSFEIPIVKVNNSSKSGLAMIKNSMDAMGVPQDVLATLSGADTDGDFVHAIRVSETPTGMFKAGNKLKGLENFDPIIEYKGTPTSKKMSKTATGLQMGLTTNLITDMSINPNVKEEELVRAVKHSMVVIDAAKHGLDYKKSYEDNNIRDLAIKYQGSSRMGGNTLFSKAGSEVVTNINTEKYKIDPTTGKKIYTTDENVHRTSAINITNPKDLSSGTKMENAYISHLNEMRKLADNVRKTAVNMTLPEYDREAAKQYKSEIASITQKLANLNSQKTEERQVQLVADTIYKEYLGARDNPSKEYIKKARTLAMNESRTLLKKQKSFISLTDAEYKALTNGALSKTLQGKIFEATSKEDLLRYSYGQKTLSPQLINDIKQWYSFGYTADIIASRLDVSKSEVLDVLNQKGK